MTSLSDGYLLSGVVLDTNQNYYYNKLTLVKVDLQGNQMWERSYGDKNNQFVQDGWNIMLKDSSLYFSSVLVRPNLLTTSVLLKFNLNGDSLWIKEYLYSLPVTDTTWFCLLGKNTTPDNGFIFTGRQSYNGQTSIVLLKTDSLGNEEWRSIMNTATYYSTGYDVVYDDISHKYIITAVQDTPISTDELTGIIITTDSLGNKINQSIKTGTNGGYLNQIIKTDDNNFIASGALSTGEPIGSFTKKKHFCIKFDHSGNTIWTREYSISGLFNWLGITKKLPDGNIILAGSFDTLSNQNLPFNSHFYLQKINQNGDSLWSRSINMVNGEGKQNLLNGLDLTNDQGFVLTGWFFGTLDSLDKRFCIAKLDEWGCDSVDCMNVGFSETNLSDNYLSVFPNPTNDLINISVSSIEFNPYFEIIDLAGRVIISDKIDKNNVSVSLFQLPCSFYFLRVADSRGCFVAKKICKI